MAKCDLSIELEDPQKVFIGGETIRGVVRVNADADVQCRGLVVTSGWRTHGRGNVATGEAGRMTLFKGEWRAGEEQSYRFELPVAPWPPSYHGHYLNIDHYIDVRAKIPWAFDPKDSVPFHVKSNKYVDDDFENSTESKVVGAIACVIIGGVASIFLGLGAMFAVFAFPWGLLFFGFIAVMIFMGWFFKVYMPKKLLGNVIHKIDETTLSPGRAVVGELVFSPRKNFKVNEVTAVLLAKEVCISGSGSNRKTHTNVLSESKIVLEEATTLVAGQEKRYSFQMPIPDDAPYSLDLDDNDLKWSVTLRVDIPRWPDWKKGIDLTIVPPDSEAIPHSSLEAPKAAAPAGQITFAETVGHVWDLREDDEMVNSLIEAVLGMTFDVEAVIERRLLYGGDDDPNVYPGGYSVWAHFTSPELPLVLFIPHQLADEFESIGRDIWRGKGTIMGWDSTHGRLQVKIEVPE